MENVFEGMTNPNTQNSQNTQTQSQPTLGNEFNLSLDELLPEDQESAQTQNEESQTNIANTDGVDDNNDENDSDEIDFQLNGSQANTAFAAMRTENKQYKAMIDRFENLSKSLGYSDMNAFISQAESRVADQKAKATGVSKEVYNELKSLEQTVNELKGTLAQREYDAKGKEVASVVQDFVNENKLTREDVDKLSKDLSKDGVTEQMLFSMPKQALVRLLGSYSNKGKTQSKLEKKEQIMKEMPVSQSSNKVDVNKLNKDIDDLAKMLAGKE